MNLVFFLSVIVLCMVVRHPLFQVLAVAASAAYCVVLRGVPGLRCLAALVGVFALVSLANPLFNTMGDTVLFYYAGSREFTWEALAFGMSTGVMLITMLLWLVCYSEVMTSDKFTYLFGGLAPALSLVLTMAFRLVPSFIRKAEDVTLARASMKSRFSQEEGVREKVKGALAIVNVLTAWAFEGAIETADSMRSRGYGLSGRARFSVYRFDLHDGVLLFVIGVLSVSVFACLALGVMSVEYYPTIVFNQSGMVLYAALMTYGVLLCIPLIVSVGEAAVWRAFLSRA